MNERKLSELQKEYRSFFLGKLENYGVKTPTQLTKDQKSTFFTEIKHGWAQYKAAKLQRAKIDIQVHSIFAENEYFTQGHVSDRLPEYTTKAKPFEEKGLLNATLTKRIIKSEPNKNQTDDLTILYSPNNHFSQLEKYQYPVVKMPKSNCKLKLPRYGRSNQKGYKELDFYNEINIQLPNVQVLNDVHLVIPNFSRPYEPDIVIYDSNINLYIDIEIDEPYDGYYRYPTHCINLEEEIKQDNVRDLFFNESGWIVIRFTEKQVHLETDQCINHIKSVLNSIYEKEFDKELKCESENQWDYNQCIQWQKVFYRERYLGIQSFKKRYSSEEVIVDVKEVETIEGLLQRTKRFNFERCSSSIAFDEETHKYIEPSDETGNAEYISVTTLIERFFPFDLRRYVERMAIEDDRQEEDVLIEYLMMRDEAAEKGTFLHSQIEMYLNGNNIDSASQEIKFFIDFYDKEILRRGLLFSEAEKMIFSERFKVAGTIDCLMKKSASDEYVMLDWKRSKKLIIDGRPRIFGYGYALSELNHLDNSSYYKYCLQQNIYKYIMEREYAVNISSMKLVVLHENYLNYYIVNVPEMQKEAQIILNSLNHKV